ncbi:hypothetical protein PHSY_003654 [Pseudozyma hubeiensis SY62]|uniref:Uncharacterized protein n=1 Tax=Pseudozyma hubeiensis (strain SY62) TaxID=1305764 RepID=R9PD91_PSEHS|nr:hypothetical protein PHSY_003654 [Pseudozyma hubeiensis SY62]GAC96075.1 hypothetical protein PHSY_003654 [Pseudozyma hubeiensis SY62]
MSSAPAPNHGGGVASDSSGPSHSRVLLGRNAGKLDPVEHPPLPVAQVGAANRAAQLRGIALGLGGGVLSAFISRKALNLSKNASYLSGLLAGTGVAYITARQQLEHNLGAVESAEKGLRTSLRNPGGVAAASASADMVSATDQAMLKYDLQAGDSAHHEGGVAGLHEFKDKRHQKGEDARIHLSDAGISDPRQLRSSHSASHVPFRLLALHWISQKTAGARMYNPKAGKFPTISPPGFSFDGETFLSIRARARARVKQSRARANLHELSEFAAQTLHSIATLVLCLDIIKVRFGSPSSSCTGSTQSGTRNDRGTT